MGERRSKDAIDRRRFFRVAGASMGLAAVYRWAPALGTDPRGKVEAARLGRANGEAPTPFTFAQLSDTHVGSGGAQNPNGTRAFERAVEEINALQGAEKPELVLFTGDLTHDSEDPKESSERMARFREIAGGLRVPLVKCVPGEHDAGLDGGDRFREAFGPTYYSFDHRGVHFVALDNVSQGKPVLGAEQLAWLEKDLARFSRTAPIVVFTHRPLFDLRPDWEWFTGDGDRALARLAPYENVTILYGHIHREHVARPATPGGPTHYAARSLAWAFPDPATAGPRKAVPYDAKTPFANLGARSVRERPGRPPEVASIDLSLTVREFSGTNGIQQLLQGGIDS
jgi:predicted phosphodiesterase